MMTEEKTPPMPDYRIGHGYDVHRFCEGDFIMMGGIKIPYQYGFLAHSDGDVLIHSLCDALLGSIAAGDIGQHFPDSDETYKNIDSSILLQKCARLVAEHKYTVANIDVTIIAQSPKMSPHTTAMQHKLAMILGISTGQINVKATTTEKLGFTGRQEGIAVHSVVLIYRAGK